MWDSKLCLLMLLCTSALAYAEDEECLLAKRYKALHKYEYLYEAESLNAINGASELRNGPKVSCKVEIEVPRTCSFIVRTTGCSLSEVAEIDADGNPVLRPAASSSDFASDMEKYPLKVVVEGVYDVKLYPEEGESTTILNIKRGIISALAVPLLEENKNTYIPTIHGMCMTEYVVNERQDIATDISLTRDLSRCDMFVPVRDHTSPLALISGMHYPLAQLIRSSQVCNYKFDNDNKHMTSAACTEKHILVPFSHKGEYGVTNVGKQSLTFEAISAHNDRVFDYDEANVKDLHMEADEDKSVIQDQDAALTLLKDLEDLPEMEGERRAHLFHKLVTTVRGMNAQTLSSTITQAVEQSPALTYQVLAQCGTPECSSATMEILKSYDSSSLQVDAAVYAFGLMSNPSPLLINDMLAMAKYKPSKPIMYALSIVVKRFYKAKQEMIPEIHSVAEFMTDQLGDCSGDMDDTFLTLRVIGNMADAMGAARPALKTAVIQCVNQPAASLSVQQAAIQAFRLTPLPEEGREVLMQVLLDSKSSVQKRVAAYLVLMKDPQPRELAQLFDVLQNEQDLQTKSFVFSHITNILSSTQPETQSLRERIRDALQGNEIGPDMDPTTFSRNYRFGSLESNMIFEGTSGLPTEAMLEMTLKAFGFDIDMMEIGMDGKGFEPTVEALFGDDGFFPDTALKTMYFVSENIPLPLKELLSNILPTIRNDRKRRQASQSLMTEIGENIKKLVLNFEGHDFPEAMVYLRLLGNEMGYIKTKDINEMAYSASLMIDNMLRMIPTAMIKGLMTSTDNKIFAHYIFMDNEFFLPTAIGVPLRFALSGTFAPGIKGGLNIARDMSKITFMPSAGIEFVTQIGSHIPGYVNSGLEMHTNLFHESGLSAQISMRHDQFKLTIPAPKDPTKLISITNSLVAVSGAGVETIPPMVRDKVYVNDCTPFFTGIKYCAALEYTDAFSHETAPYFPFTGDSKMSVEIHYSEEVTEYTATIAYELLKDGEGGILDSVKLILRAEAVEPSEAIATMKYNRKKHILTTDVQIPDFDVEAGFRLGIDDGITSDKRTHTISLQLINKDIPQLSLVGRANLKAMKEGMLQVQILVPSLEAEATLTANMKNDGELVYELESNITLLETTSMQKLTVKYDSTRIEADVSSDIKSEVLEFLGGDEVKMYVNNILDTRVGDTDMKVRHIVTKSVEATNNYLEKYATDIPFFYKIRVPDMPELSMPEALFMNVDAKAVYYFNNERFIISIPLPLGGKSTQEFPLGFPPALTIPHFLMSEFGLDIAPVKIPIPEVFVPEQLTISVPLFGKAEISTKMKSNLYDLKASMAFGKDVVEAPSCSAMFNVEGTSPLDILSFKMEGSGMLSTSDHLKAHLKSSLVHKLINAQVNIFEDVTVTDKINVGSNSRIQVTSPFGVDITLEYTGIAGINSEEISADSKFEGIFEVGPISDKTIFTQSFTIFPFRPEAKVDSNLIVDSTIFKGKNTIAATFVNGELRVLTNSNAFDDMLTHAAEFSYTQQKLSLKCDTNALAFGMQFHNEAEATASAGAVLLKMETSANQFENRVHSLFTASLDDNGLAYNSDATVKLFENLATHKATLRMNKDGVAASGTNSLQSPLTLSNTFKAGFDASSATLNIKTNAALLDISVDNTNSLTITLSSLDFNSKTNVGDDTSYTHDISIVLKPHAVSANVNNNLRVLAANFKNQAQLEAELYKVHLTGSMKAIYADEEIKHTYDINYADMMVAAKCSTTGTLFGTHMSHNTEVEVVGLAAIFSNDARFNSQLMRFDHTIRASIVPFDFNLDAIFNADGDLTLFGKQSAQLYGKFLLKAQPLAFASSHEYRASVTQQLNNGLSLETTMDHKMDTVLSPQEQQTNLRITSKMNDHAFNQALSVYNTAERIGLEVTGAMLTNMLNTESTENQEFSISGFLKYDKNTNSHIIQLPLIENLPAFLEIIKVTVVTIAEALQNIINNEQVRSKLEALPELVSDVFAQLNIKNRADQLKEYVTRFTLQYTISMKDLEDFMKNLNAAVAKLFAKLATHVDTIKDIIVSSLLSDTFIQKIQEGITAFDEYVFKRYLVAAIRIIKNIIREIDVMAKINMVLNDLEVVIESFDVSMLVAEVKSFILDIKFKHLFELPQEIIRSINIYIMEFIQDFKIIDTINAFCSKIREIIIKLQINRKIQFFIDSTANEVKMFIDKIEKKMNPLIIQMRIMEIPTKCMHAIENTISYLKATEVKDMIEQLNIYLNMMIQQLRTLDYNSFVEKANHQIAICTTHVNNLIQSLEIPENLNALIENNNRFLDSISKMIEVSRKFTVSNCIESVRHMLDYFVFKDLRTLVDIVTHEITAIDIRPDITFYLRQMSKYYIRFITEINNFFTDVVHFIDLLISDYEFISEIKQIKKGLITALKTAELYTPSFTFPLTDIVIPSMKISMDKLHEINIPTQMDIPMFTIMGFYTVPAATISCDVIKQRIIELINFIFSLKYIPERETHFGRLTLSFLPPMPEIIFPEINFEIKAPVIPKISVEKLVKTLQVPEIRLPAISSKIMVPCFGKLYGEMKFKTPVYSIKTSAELQNSTENALNPLFVGFFSSEATAPYFEALNYKLDTTAHIAFPKMRRVIIKETLKLNHSALEVDHQASVTLYGPPSASAQAKARTAVSVLTAPYTAKFINAAAVAIAGGITASLDTTYNHMLTLPIIEFTSEATLTQKAYGKLDGTTITLSVDNDGTGKFNDEAGTHNSHSVFTINPTYVKLTFSADTDSTFLKIKQQMTADSVMFGDVQFDISSEAEGLVIKKSRFAATGKAYIFHPKIELNATHETELRGLASGVHLNSVKLYVYPTEFTFVFNSMHTFETLTTLIELQNDYSAIFKSDKQQITTLARLNQHRVFYNFTVVNNAMEAGCFVAIDVKGSLEFLNSPIDIPEFDLPFVNVHMPAIRDLNLYEQTALQDIFTTTEQDFNIDAMILYQKSQIAPLVDVSLIQVPSLGNLVSELTFKSTIVNLNVNAGLYNEENLVFRLGASTASVFESLKAKLDGSMSLTTKGGIKVANSLSLVNSHIKGTQESTLAMSTDTLEVNVETVGTISLPVLNLEASQNLLVQANTKVNVASSMKLKGNFDVPLMPASGTVEAESSLKIEGSLTDAAMESTTKAKLDGNVFEHYVILGVLDNEANMYLSDDGMRSAFKMNTDVKLNQGSIKVFGMDLNEDLAVDASPSHVYAVLKCTGNNEVNIFNFNTKGIHVARATVDIAPSSSVTAEIDINLSQPSCVGDFTVSKKSVIEVTVPKLKMTTTAKIATPMYTTDMVVEVEGDSPVFKAMLKSTGTSPIVFLDYDMSANFENDGVNMKTSAVLTHSDMTITAQYANTLALSSGHTINVDITSPIFTDVKAEYTVSIDAIHASISTPSTGALGLEFNAVDLSQMHAKLYGMYTSSPESDEIFVIRTTPHNVHLTYNMNAPNDMLTGLKERLPAITSAFKIFADKYQFTFDIQGLSVSASNYITMVYNTAINHNTEMSELSIFFRNVIVEYQKAIQMFLEIFIEVLRETPFRLPCSDTRKALPQILQMLTSSIATCVEDTMQFICENTEVYISTLDEMLGSYFVSGDPILKTLMNALKRTINKLVFIAKHESLDMMLVRLGGFIKAMVEKSQEFIDSIQFEFLNLVFLKLNSFYLELITVEKNLFDVISKIDMEYFNNVTGSIIQFTIDVVISCNIAISDFLQQASEEVKTYVTVSRGKIEFDLPFQE